MKDKTGQNEIFVKLRLRDLSLHLNVQLITLAFNQIDRTNKNI